MTSAPGAAPQAARALARIPGMADATLGEVLADGPTNTTFLVSTPERRFVLRLDKPAAANLGLDRASEQAICRAVATAGLGPPYHHFDAAAGVCLRPFVEGVSLAPADLREGRTLDELAAALRRLHALPVVGRRFDPCAAARRYASHLGTTAAADLAHRAATLIDPVPPPTATGALCHNDLVAENVLRTPERGLVLIDWEYSGIGDPYFDLAVVIRHHGLGDAPEGHLLACYLQREPREAERRHLRRQCDFYGVLLDLWNLRVGNL